MDFKRSLTLLSIFSLLFLLGVLVSSFFIELTIFEVIISTVLLTIFALRAHFRKRIKGIYIVSSTAQFIILILFSVFIMMIPSVGIVSIISLLLTIYSASSKVKRRIILAEAVLLFSLIILTVLYIANFPAPVE
jgi:hypothetical protein